MTSFAGYSAIVPDVGATVDFYRRAFALELRYLHPSGDYAELLTGDVLLSFTGERLWEAFVAGETSYVRGRPANSPGPGYIALVVEDLPAALTRGVETSQ